MKEKLQGLQKLTEIVLEHSFKDYRLDQLTAEDMEILSNIVFHHVFRLPMFECDVLVFSFGLCKQEIKSLEAIGRTAGFTASEIGDIAGKAFRDLVDASWIDILKTLIDIRNKKERGCTNTNQ